MLAPTATENTAAKKSSATRSAIVIRPALPQSFPTVTVAVAATIGAALLARRLPKVYCAPMERHPLRLSRDARPRKQSKHTTRLTRAVGRLSGTVD